MSDLINAALPIIIGFLLVWFTYLNINYFYTIFKLKKSEKEMELCNTKLGIVVNYVALAVYIAGTIASLALLVNSLLCGTFVSNGTFYLNILALLAIFANQYFSRVIYLSKKSLIIGRIKFDYRKIKRIDIHPTKMSFNYGQNHLATRLLFVDDEKLRVTLKRNA
ncbi:MAG: hypothetical protein PHI41_00390 [Erysipelotrichaceae bacterium]|nr:hypothetical protein [Erysipelotrichaceae bacterium]